MDPPLDPPLALMDQPLVLPQAPPIHSNQYPMITRTRDGTRKPKTYSAVRHPLPTTLPLEPTTYKTVATNPNWVKAMEFEYNALLRNNTWSLVLFHPSMNIIGTKWIYRLKLDVQGNVDRYKARLVAKGYTQRPVYDFEETFSPVVKHGTVCLVLSLAVCLNWPLHQLDVTNAFLHGELQETIYIQQPVGFIDPAKPTHVCRLHKALYGLKQAPRVWFQKFTNFLQTLGFIGCPHDPSFFIWHQNDHTLLLLLYVDDLVLTGNCSALISALIRRLSSVFTMKDLGQLHLFLGVQVSRQPDRLFLSQTRYALQLLHRFGLQHSKPILSPLAAGVQLFKGDSALLPDPTLFRQMVGSLQYLTLSRPDLAHAVSHVCQFMHSPTVRHMEAVKRIFRYVKGSTNLGLHISPGSPYSLRAYSDADWAGCPDTRRSVTGYTLFFGPNLVSWGSKKQPTVSRSSSEAEYRALAATATEVMWFVHLLRMFGISLAMPPVLHCDNSSAIHLARHSVFHSRTKHIGIDVHFICEQVQALRLAVAHISGQRQLADIFTKSLPIQRFLELRRKLLVLPPPMSLRGAVSKDRQLPATAPPVDHG
ncbi:hypothetical protein Dimus_039558 [Dionaea muscipula]